ncbi:MAG TPA: nickel pincer cofactor biosynthesis protein LarC [Jiangellaceae bacterium]|nr:nickel pincer cofactor biosynthesis protein LarC [Jiangellaceae bacterium]
MIGWLDCSSGASGDMLLAVLIDAGAPLGLMQQAVDAFAPEPVQLRVEEVHRRGLRATRVHVDAAESTTRRTWNEIRQLLDDDTRLTGDVRRTARTAFERLAEAEARVHGVPSAHVHFHEVGALDAIADVVGVAAGFSCLGLSELHVSPVALGSGTVSSDHGLLPVPPPAVVELLTGAPTFGGDAGVELTTPTGAALISTLATGWGPQPPMAVARQGIGAGGRELPDRANVLRLLVGEPLTVAASTMVLEANVDDMDPRLWPLVLSHLLEAGASDAWLTPIVMKKGRLAHTLSVLVDGPALAAVRSAVFTETTTIGLREVTVHKRALDRAERSIEIDGHRVRVKTATLDGMLVNAQPEYDDVVAAATAAGRPVKAVLAEATAAVRAAGLAP